MNSDLIRLQYQQIASPQGRARNLPEQPGIYAWYRDLRIGDQLYSEQSFLSAVSELLSPALSPRLEGSLGYLYRVAVEERPIGLAEASRNSLEIISRNSSAREGMSSALVVMSQFLSPLYIGKSHSLRERVATHVNGGSGLRQRLQQAGIRLDRCLLSFRALDPHLIQEMADCLVREGVDTDAANDEVLRLTEDVITRLAPASFVRRPG